MGSVKVYNSYDRPKRYLEAGNILKIIDYEGKESWYRIARSEAMGKLSVVFANAANVLAVGGATAWFPCEFLEPQSENVIYQARPAYEIVDINGGSPLLASINAQARVDIQWEHPAGRARGGTDWQDTNLVVNGIANNVGGLGNGVMNPFVIPYMDDMSGVYDLWTMYGTFPRFRATNNGELILGNESASPEITTNYTHTLMFTGRKYMVEDITDRMYELIMNHEYKNYYTATIGGIPAVSSR